MGNRLFIALSLLILSFAVHGQETSELFTLVKENNISKLDSLLKTGLAKGQELDENGHHILMIAAMHSDSSMLSRLLKIYAISGNFKGIHDEYLTLIETKRNVWLGDLMAASAFKGHWANLEFFNRQGLSIDSQIKSSEVKFSMWTPLMHASHTNGYKAVKWLMEHGADPSLKNEEGKTAIDLCEDPSLISYLESKNTALIDGLIKIDSLNRAFEVTNQKSDAQGMYLVGKEKLDLAAKIYPKSSLFYAQSLDHLSFGYAFTSQYEKAIPLIEQSIQITEDKLGKDHERYSIRLNNMAYMYNALGDYASTYRILLQAQKIIENDKNIDPKTRSTLLINIGVALRQLGDYDRALEYGLKAKKMIIEAGVKNNFELFDITDFLASIYGELGQYEKSCSLRKKALKLMKDEVGENHPSSIEKLNAIAMILDKMGHKQEALDSLNKVIKLIKINKEENLEDWGYYQFNRGKLLDKYGQHEKATDDLIKSLELAATFSGTNNDLYGSRLTALAQNYQNLNNPDKASENYLLLLDNLYFNLKNRLPYLPEKLQLIHLKKYYQHQAALNSFFLDKELPNKVYEFNNLVNGFTLRNLQSINFENDDYPKWKELKEKISKELSIEKDKRNVDLEVWEKDLERLESSNLFYNSLHKPETVTVEKLREKIKDDELIICFDRFDYLSPNLTDSIIYVARVIEKKSNTINQVLLFEEAELKKLMKDDQDRRADFVLQLYDYKDRGIVIDIK